MQEMLWWLGSMMTMAALWLPLAEAFLGRLARTGIGRPDAATPTSFALAAVAAGPARFGASLGGQK